MHHGTLIVSELGFSDAQVCFEPEHTIRWCRGNTDGVHILVVITASREHHPIEVSESTVPLISYALNHMASGMIILPYLGK